MIYLVHDGSIQKHDIQIRVCSSFLSRFLGALPDGRISEHHGILLTRCRQVHTWFMRTPISLLFLSGHGRLLRYEPCLHPFRISRRIKEATGVLEMAPRPFPPSDLTEQTYVRFDPPTARRAGLDSLVLEDRPDRSSNRRNSEIPRRHR